ncbi:hypothetical protein [Malacoplasma penetrans HF-2]|uniref:Uncharacterized protein n=1 Tax=Malacoplasma penetrans (strain HF-2) TaxID=272633 RepID=Q8EVL3_MALP2|nr:hypothetical protein [Malacoplasma penetrans HF-2]
MFSINKKRDAHISFYAEFYLIYHSTQNAPHPVFQYLQIKLHTYKCIYTLRIHIYVNTENEVSYIFAHLIYDIARISD